MRALGNFGPLSSDIGLGCMGMSDLYGPTTEADSIATIRKALDAGITLLDTGDYYGMGHNEMLIQKALVGRSRENVLISVKFGALRDPQGNWLGFDARPNAAKTFLAYTLRRLGTDYVDIYRPGRLDSAVPIEETIGALGDLVKAGFVRHIGLSETGGQTIRRAQAVHPISDVQMEYSLISRSIEQEILPTCRELGIGVTAYSVLSRGLLSGHWSKDRSVAPNDFRKFAPRFAAGNVEKNLTLVEQLRNLAQTRNTTVAQVAVAWVLSRGIDIVPLVGARRPEQLDEVLGAFSLRLSADDLAQLERAVPAESVAGDRYPAPVMAGLDSERRTR